MGDCGNAVIENGEHAVTRVIQVVGDIGLGKHSIFLCQVAVGEVISQIFGGDNAMLYVFWEDQLPQNWMLPLGKEDTTHSSSSSNHSTNHTE